MIFDWEHKQELGRDDTPEAIMTHYRVKIPKWLIYRWLVNYFFKWLFSANYPYAYTLDKFVPGQYVEITQAEYSF